MSKDWDRWVQLYFATFFGVIPVYLILTSSVEIYRAYEFRGSLFKNAEILTIAFEDRPSYKTGRAFLHCESGSSLRLLFRSKFPSSLTSLLRKTEYEIYTPDIMFSTPTSKSDTYEPVTSIPRVKFREAESVAVLNGRLRSMLSEPLSEHEQNQLMEGLTSEHMYIYFSYAETATRFRLRKKHLTRNLEDFSRGCSEPNFSGLDSHVLPE